MDDNKCIPEYKVLKGDSPSDIEKQINALAKEGFVIQHFAAATGHNYSTFMIVMSRPMSRLEALVKDGTVVQ